MMARIVQPETLDFLPEDDPRALRSRADLRRINRIMGTRRIMISALRRLHQPTYQPTRMIELGAGDGSLMLAIARTLAHDWRGVHLTLLDRQNLVADTTVSAFHQLGWQVEIVRADLLEWMHQPAAERYDIVLANLFFHHFENAQLAAIFAALVQRADALCMCEPRRAQLALVASHLVGLIGANDVTREDAVLSVRAGFAGSELSRLLPPECSGWQREEYAAGLFSHCLVAARPTL